jgi:hypothetical protein
MEAHNLSCETKCGEKEELECRRSLNPEPRADGRRHCIVGTAMIIFGEHYVIGCFVLAIHRPFFDP